MQHFYSLVADDRGKIRYVNSDGNREVNTKDFSRKIALKTCNQNTSIFRLRDMFIVIFMRTVMQRFLREAIGNWGPVNLARNYFRYCS